MTFKLYKNINLNMNSKHQFRTTTVDVSQRSPIVQDKSFGLVAHSRGTSLHCMYQQHHLEVSFTSGHSICASNTTSLERYTRQV
jgi:hypothetical protein